jgi:hypothetical protein
MRVLYRGVGLFGLPVVSELIDASCPHTQMSRSDPQKTADARITFVEIDVVVKASPPHPATLKGQYCE